MHVVCTHCCWQIIYYSCKFSPSLHRWQSRFATHRLGDFVQALCFNPHVRFRFSWRNPPWRNPPWFRKSSRFSWWETPDNIAPAMPVGPSRLKDRSRPHLTTWELLPMVILSGNLHWQGLPCQRRLANRPTWGSFLGIFSGDLFWGSFLGIYRGD